MIIPSKKFFAVIDYASCNPNECDPDSGKCSAVSACSYKVIKQIDDAFEEPIIFQDLCMGCCECATACPLGAIYRHKIS
jgi:ATP-binding cassette subfamily E protein 1